MVKMLFKITYNPIVVLTLLKSLLNHQVEKLGEFDVDRLYKKEGLLVYDQVLPEKYCQKRQLAMQQN